MYLYYNIFIAESKYFFVIKIYCFYHLLLFYTICKRKICLLHFFRQNSILIIGGMLKTAANMQFIAEIHNT
jgi:hypothetical protein